MKPKQLVIVGTGGLAKEAAQLARVIDPSGSRWATISYVAEDAQSLGVELPFGSVRYTDQQLVARSQSGDVVIGIGNPTVRRNVARRLKDNRALRFPNLIHPSVELDEDWVAIGRGNMITKGVIMTVNIRVGDFNVINWNATIGHDTEIGSYNVVNPGANIGGCVQVLDECLLGAGCQVLERKRICSNATIGAGAVVIGHIAEPGTYIGVPARRIPNK